MNTISAYYKEVEPDVCSSLIRLSTIVKPAFGLIRNLKRVRQHYDEPKFWHYSAAINNNYGKHEGRKFHTQASGVSFFSQNLALLRCLGEAVERYSNHVFLKNTTSFTGSFTKIKGGALSPSSFTGFSENQLRKRNLKHFRINEKSLFKWTKCVSLNSGKTVQIPSQLIYLSYPFLRKEPIIYPAISTGVAGGACLSAALIRGIYETIERDSFMIFYLNRLQAPRIRLNLIRDNKVQKLLKIADRYKLEIVSVDITSDLGIPVIATIVINRVGTGKAISVGLKCDLNPIKALIGSVNEAFHSRDWIRREYEKEPKTVKQSLLLRQTDIITRGFLWYPTERIRRLNFWIRSPKVKLISEKYKTLPSGGQLKLLLELFDKFGYEVYFKNLMAPSPRELNYYVVKVIISQMQPLYLNEKYPLLGGKRLYDVPERLGYERKSESDLNTYPHPFL